MGQFDLGLRSMLMLLLNIMNDPAWHNFLIFRMATGVPNRLLMMLQPFPVNNKGGGAYRPESNFQNMEAGV